MARGLERLSPLKIRNAAPGKSKTGKRRSALMLCDGGGLYLQATRGAEDNVRRSWIFRYQRSGHPVRDMGLGSLNDVSLGEARDLARKYRRLVKDGVDPIAHRDAEVAKKLAESRDVMTFDQAAEAYIRQHRSTWKNPVHAAQWPSTLKTYASPVIGKLSVADITTPHVVKVLEKIWHEKPETASRVRMRIEAVLAWSIVSGHRSADNPARWRGHLDKLLPARSKVRKVVHQRSLPYADMPAFMAELRKRKAVAALALEFTVLTCVRTSDVLKAKWTDINWNERVWLINELSKTHRQHRVPLSDAALAVLDKVREITKGVGGKVAHSEFVFPNDVTGAALSNGALLALIERMGRKGEMTTHGCRSTFRTWAQEQTSFPWEVAEMSLGHVVGSKVERAYARGDALKKRVAIMQAWGTFLAKPSQPAKVIPMQGQRAQP
jgi:integrase